MFHPVTLQSTTVSTAVSVSGRVVTLLGLDYLDYSIGEIDDKNDNVE